MESLVDAAPPGTLELDRTERADQIDPIRWAAELDDDVGLDEVLGAGQCGDIAAP